MKILGIYFLLTTGSIFALTYPGIDVFPVWVVVPGFVLGLVGAYLVRK